MSIFERYIRAADEIVSFEATLGGQDFTLYGEDGLDFEKEELSKIWEEYKKLYDECSSETMKKKKELVAVQTKHPQDRKMYVRCVNIISKARTDLKAKREKNAEAVSPNLCGSIAVSPCDTNVFSWWWWQ